MADDSQFEQWTGWGWVLTNKIEENKELNVLMDLLLCV